jgi:hypothetical protein
MEAAYHGHIDLLQRFLDAGAEKDTQDEMGRSPLWIGASRGNVEVVRRLLDAGADRNLPDTMKGRTPLAEAMERQHLAVIQAFKEHAFLHRNAPGALADDSPSNQDRLSVRSMCHAVANFLLTESTPSPLALVFNGPWGKGKSTIMNLVEASLRILPLLRSFPDEDGNAPATVHQQAEVLNCLSGLFGRPSKELVGRLQTRHASTVTNLRDLDKLFDRPTAGSNVEGFDGKELLTKKLFEQAAHRVMLPVRFNAWLYRDSKEIWAGLAVTIGQAMEARLGWLERGWASLRYGWDRRRRELVASVIIPFILALLFALILALSAPRILAALRKPPSASPPGQAKTVSAPGDTSLSVLAITLQILGPVGAFLFSTWRLNTFLKPVSERIADYVRTPSSNHLANLGYQNAVIEDLEFLGSFLPGIRLVIIIDDLDRCQDKAVADVLEAVNLVLGGCNSQRLKVYTVLGLDMEMTVKAIYNYYNSSATSEGVEVERLTRDESRRFLQKIVQVSIEVPPTTTESRNKYIQELFESLGPSKGLLESPSGLVDNLGTELTSFKPADQEPGPQIDPKADKSEVYSDQPPRQAELAINKSQTDVERGSRQDPPMAKSIILNGSRDNKVYGAMLCHFSERLPDNPREIKRMVNNYCLARIVLDWSNSVPDVEAMQKQLVVWVVLVVTFPSIAPKSAWLFQSQGSGSVETKPAVAGSGLRLERQVERTNNPDARATMARAEVGDPPLHNRAGGGLQEQQPKELGVELLRALGTGPDEDLQEGRRRQGAELDGERLLTADTVPNLLEVTEIPERPDRGDPESGGPRAALEQEGHPGTGKQGSLLRVLQDCLASELEAKKRSFMDVIKKSHDPNMALKDRKDALTLRSTLEVELEEQG